MANTLQINRGQKSNLPVLNQGELAFVTDEDASYVGDGAANHRHTMKGDTDLTGFGWFLDEDDFTSDDATKVASQQSIKAYVDANAGGGSSFAVNVETLSGDKTIAEGDAHTQLLDPGGVNRAVLLPGSPSSDIEYEIVNAGTYNDSEYLEVKISGDSNYFTRLYPSSGARFVYDTTNGTWSCVGPGFRRRRTGTDTYDEGHKNTNVGYGGNGSTYGANVGYGGDGSSNGANVGSNGNGSTYGANVGYNGDGYNYGANVGYDGNGSNYGANVGYNGDTQNNLYAKAIGAYSRAERYGEFGQTVDHQSACKKHLGQVAWQGQTTDATQTELYLHGVSANRCTVLASSVIAFEIRVAAFDSTNGEVYHEVIEGTIHRDGSNNTAIKGSNSSTVVTNTTSGTPAVSVEADDTNEALVVKVTGLASTTIDWLVDGRLVDCRINA